ncbi:MAG: glycosyltransferase [Limisphaerales bacterium]
MDRRAFYDQLADTAPARSRKAYHRLLRHYLGHLVRPGARVLEVGCGLGDTLAALKPARGVGVDFSPRMIGLARQRHPDLEFHVADALDLPGDETFDIILASDLVNDLPDVQAVLEKLHRHARPDTRLVVNFFNNLWRPFLACAEMLGVKARQPTQNWLSTGDMRNLLRLAGWTLIKEEGRMLYPLPTLFLGHLLNRWLAPLLRPFCLTFLQVARPVPEVPRERHFTCSVVIPARNEAGNIEAAVLRTPEMGAGTEIVFIEGNSKDNTWAEIQRVKDAYPQRDIRILQQTGKGKGNAVRDAFAVATGDILFILDADLTMPPEQLPKFYEAIRSGKAEFVNGVRLVYPMEDEAMRFANMVANHFFGLAFTFLLGQRLKDTLCGTKVLFRRDYEVIAANRAFFGDFDPFGDFDLLFGAAKQNLQIVDLPIRYAARTYGETNIQRWRHGVVLLRMVIFAARRLKFI